MAHPKRKTKHPRSGELKTVSAGRSRRRLLTLSKKSIGRKAVREFTGLDDKTLRQIKNQRTKYVRRETQDLIFSVPFNAHCERALVDAKPTQKLIEKLVEPFGFTKSEIARRLNPKVMAKYRPGHAWLNIGRKRVTARTAMRIEKFYNRYAA